MSKNEKEVSCKVCQEKKFIQKDEIQFKCKKCRTLNVIVESKNNEISNPKVNVTIYETMSRGPTLDYLRENGLPNWLKD